MKKAALYARVSSELQKKEQTIKSQVSELKRQIVNSGHVLVKKYIDDGFPGKNIDRPALNKMRQDLETNLFDVIYFLCNDRLARKTEHQRLIISEILGNGKRLVINGQDYEQNPENELSMQVLGAAAEYERAKIVERTMRGRLHKIRQGQISSQGCNVFGYDYIRKTADSPPRLVINKEEAKTVKYIFELYANGKAGVCGIPRILEEKGLPTYKGKKMWRAPHIRCMLKNETYAGVKYYNTMYKEQRKEGKIRNVKYGKKIMRDKSEWLAVKVPAIISRELFNRVQKQMIKRSRKYTQPPKQQLLSGLIKCGECGYAYASYKRRTSKKLKTGIKRVYHRSAYACSWRLLGKIHSKKVVKHCKASEVATHILEDKVFEIMNEYFTKTKKLKTCMDFFKQRRRTDERRVGQRMKRIEEREKTIEDEKQKLIDDYAIGKISQKKYIDRNIKLDQRLYKVKNKKAELLEKIPLLHKKEVVELNMRQFCDNAKLKLERCKSFEDKRKLITDYIEKIIYKKYHVTIIGSMPIVADGRRDGKIPFRIEGVIDKSFLHSRPRKKYDVDGRLKKYRSGILQTKINI